MVPVTTPTHVRLKSIGKTKKEKKRREETRKENKRKESEKGKEKKVQEDAKKSKDNSTILRCRL